MNTAMNCRPLEAGEVLLQKNQSPQGRIRFPLGQESIENI